MHDEFFKFYHIQKYIILIFSTHTRIWNVYEEVQKESNQHTQVQVFFFKVGCGLARPPMPPLARTSCGYAYLAFVG